MHVSVLTKKGRVLEIGASRPFPGPDIIRNNSRSLWRVLLSIYSVIQPYFAKKADLSSNILQRNRPTDGRRRKDYPSYFSHTRFPESSSDPLFHSAPPSSVLPSVPILQGPLYQNRVNLFCDSTGTPSVRFYVIQFARWPKRHFFGRIDSNEIERGKVWKPKSSWSYP